MRQAKKKLQVAPRPKRTTIDVGIEERLAACGRGEPEHIIYVGNLVENFLKGETGAIIKALTAGRVSTEIRANMSGKLAPERVLGRIEAYENLWNDLEQFVLDKDKISMQVDVVDEHEYHTATEPSEQQRHTINASF